MFHPPGLIAKMAATIQEVSGGRFVLGLGAGWNETEYRAFGLPYDHRVSRFEESFEIVRRTLAGERVTLEGRFWQAEDLVVLPLPEEPVPLMIGSNGPRMLAATLPYVDRWNTWYDRYGNTVEGFAELNAFVTEQCGARRPRPGRDLPVDRGPGRARPGRGRSGRTPTRRGEPVTPDALCPRTSHALEEAGADEAILILRPITEESIRAIAGTRSFGHAVRRDRPHLRLDPRGRPPAFPPDPRRCTQGLRRRRRDLARTSPPTWR